MRPPGEWTQNQIILFAGIEIITILVLKIWYMTITSLLDAALFSVGHLTVGLHDMRKICGIIAEYCDNDVTCNTKINIKLYSVLLCAVLINLTCMCADSVQSDNA